MAPIPGEIVFGDGPIEINRGRPVLTLLVRNTGDRPVQVGSHYHFAAANPALEFDRDAAWGTRLAVPAGTAVRFEPGIEREVDLVPLAGARVVPGLRPDSAGPLDRALGDDEATATSEPAATSETPGTGEAGGTGEARGTEA